MYEIHNTLWIIHCLQVKIKKCQFFHISIQSIRWILLLLLLVLSLIIIVAKCSLIEHQVTKSNRLNDAAELPPTTPELTA